MASEPLCSRPSSFGLRPGPPVPSRTSSLKISRKPNFTTAASPVSATSSGETPALSSGPVHSKRQSLTQNPDSLGFLQHDPAISLPGCSSRRPQSSSVSRRPASCSATLRRPMAPQVKRWAGLTRTVSEWGGWDGGLRRVSWSPMTPKCATHSPSRIQSSGSTMGTAWYTCMPTRPANALPPSGSPTPS